TAATDSLDVRQCSYALRAPMSRPSPLPGALREERLDGTGEVLAAVDGRHDVRVIHLSPGRVQPTQVLLDRPLGQPRTPGHLLDYPLRGLVEVLRDLRDEPAQQRL